MLEPWADGISAQALAMLPTKFLSSSTRDYGDGRAWPDEIFTSF
ncbi:hypothetical protein EV13_1010 [Prochlorococcus sp. MIT 0702]|nr:hypothetical protein EV12_1048 [Prochlorococcus sp. MIT 0701]KGG29544.1 hypothetical protein EV13_1010 [Prochlorococcus sp. MIT 0702]